MQVGVKKLKVVGIEGWTMMREGEAEKQVYIYLIISLFICVCITLGILFFTYIKKKYYILCNFK